MYVTLTVINVCALMYVHVHLRTNKDIYIYI